MQVPPYHAFLPSWLPFEEPPCPALRLLLLKNLHPTHFHPREEEWQFPAQIMPVVRDTVAHAGFKITKVTTGPDAKGCLPFLILMLAYNQTLSDF